MDKFLFKHIDNTGLTLWRIAFGLLIAAEGFGAIATGWVKNTLITPNFTFHFIGFEFLQPLPGNGMYFYFALMGIFGLMVMLGYKYRVSMFCYAFMWSCVYLMQKTSYNNHYYLMMLLCWIMVFVPAHRWFSLDAKLNPKIQSKSVARWTYMVVILLIWIVYTYAAIAKIYPDWLNGSATSILMSQKEGYWLIGSLLQERWVHFTMAYFGICFDLFIIPMLLWKRTRLIGFYISIFFHLFNSIIFQIGIFPYMSMAFSFFFFSPETLQKRFFLKQYVYTGHKLVIPKYKFIWVGVFFIFFCVQIALPLRHWGFKDSVLWTEEGHRLSWRMMLRSKGGSLVIYTKEKGDTLKKRYPYKKLLSEKQQRKVAVRPDMLWQLAQRIKTIEAKKGKEIAVYAKCYVKINGGKLHQFIDPNVDLASQKWFALKHHDWILPSPKN